MLERVRARLQSLLSAMARGAIRLHLSPGEISALGVVFSALAFISFIFNRGQSALTAAAGVLVLLSGVCDALDGSVARLRGEVTVLGGFMDSTIDRYSDSLILAGPIAGGLVDLHWGLAALIGSLLTSYARAKADSIGVRLSGVGLVERSERLLIIAASALMEGVLPGLGLLNYAVASIAFLSNATVLQRILHVRRALRGKG